MRVLVVGSVAIDDIRTPNGEAKGVLGGSASYFSLAAAHLAPVRIVAVVGEDFPQPYLDLLRDRDIVVDGVERLPGKSFFWSGSYGEEFKVATTHETRLGVFEHFNPVLSEADRETAYLFLANIDPDLQLRVLDQVRGPKLVVLDTMNFWIASKLDALDQVLRRVDVALLNDEELVMLTGSTQLVPASRRILEAGPSAVVVKKGEHGAFLRTRDDYFSLPAYPAETVRDPTGAGDSFAGGFLGHLCRIGRTDGEALRTAVAHGIAMASFTVEDFSVQRLLSIRPNEIGERIAALRDMTRFSI